jgi:Flp pilus assembly secretin CpaC
MVLQDLLTIPASVSGAEILEGSAPMRRAISMLALIWATSTAASSAVAAHGGLAVELNHSRRVVVPGAIANVLVVDPKVADVAVLDDHSVIVLGRGYGETEIVVTDHAGRLLMDSRIAVTGNAGGLVTVYHGTQDALEYSCSSRCALTASNGQTETSSANAASSNEVAPSSANTPMTVQSPVTATVHAPVLPP